MITKSDLAYWQQNENIREQFTALYHKRVQRSIYASVLPIIRNLRKATELDQFKHIIDATDQAPQQLENTITTIYIQAGTESGESTLNSITLRKAETTSSTSTGSIIEPTFFQTAMRNFAKTVGASKVTSITRTNELILRDIVLAATENGWSVQRTVKHMVSFFDGELSSARALMIARTEVMTASSYANNLTGNEIERLGIKLKKKWIPTPTGKFRPTHLAMGSKPPILFTDLFLVGGTLMEHPHDSNAPASEVINCRCSMRFIPI